MTFTSSCVTSENTLKDNINIGNKNNFFISNIPFESMTQIITAAYQFTNH
ncbi:hypothetical protein IFVP182_C240015 [Vibrio parahaemolyticus]